MAIALVEGSQPPTAQRLVAIKNQLRADHAATWGDILIPEGLIPQVTEQTRSVSVPFNDTAVAEADAVAWQWGFWPFTRIETLVS